MENRKNDGAYSYTIHQTSFLLILRLILTEIIIMMATYSIRVLLNQITEYLNWQLPLFIITSEVIILQIINLYLIINIVLQWINLTYTFNPKEVIIRQGVFSTNSVTYEFANLQSMTIVQNIIQKIFNYGTIKLFNPVLKEDVYLIDIPDPNKYANIIQQYQPDMTPIIKKQK